MKVESIISHRLIKDHMVSNYLQPHTIDISREMMLSVKVAHQRYKDQQKIIAESAKKRTK